MKPTRYLLLVLIPIFLLASSCPFLNFWNQKRAAVHEVTPCIVLTGEHLYPIEITGRLPETARPGDRLTITFTGGYMVLPKCEKRNGTEYYHYPTTQELSAKMRTAVIQLDGQDLTAVRCANDCQIDFFLPADTKVGEHMITLVTGGVFFNPKDTTFAINVIAWEHLFSPHNLSKKQNQILFKEKLK